MDTGKQHINSIQKRYQYLIFGIMSILFLIEGITQWKIHVLLWENSHVMSGLFQSEWFYVSNNRVGMFATQILPLIGLKLNLPNNWIFILQSLNYVLLHLCLIGWVIFGFKDVTHGIFIFIVLFLGGFYIHYSKEYALINSLVYSLVFASYLKSKFKAEKWFEYLIIVGFLVLILYTFTLALFFVVPLLLLDYKRLGTKAFLVSFATIGVVFIITFIQSNYIMQNVSEVGGGSFSRNGIQAVSKSLNQIALYYSTFIVLILSVFVIVKRKVNKQMWLVWFIHFVFLIIAIRYLIAVCASNFEFDISNLILIRVEVTLFIIIASLIYFYLEKLDWNKSLLIGLFIASIGRFVFLSYSCIPVNKTIESKEHFITQLAADYPDKKVFIVSRACPNIPKGYELDDFKHESNIMSTYLGNPIIVYLTDNVQAYRIEDKELMVSGNNQETVELSDQSLIDWKFNPFKEYPKMNLKITEIQLVQCD